MVRPALARGGWPARSGDGVDAKDRGERPRASRISRRHADPILRRDRGRRAGEAAIRFDEQPKRRTYLGAIHRPIERNNALAGDESVEIAAAVAHPDPVESGR